MKKKIFLSIFLTSLFLIEIIGIVNGIKKTKRVEAAPNCPIGFQLVGDFCISSEEREGKWKDCCDYEKSRLCSSAELTAAFTILSNKQNRPVDWSGSWSADLVESGAAIWIEYPNSRNTPVEIEKKDIGEKEKYHCCLNL